jgi:hypothetical protein
MHDALDGAIGGGGFHLGLGVAPAPDEIGEPPQELPDPDGDAPEVEGAF